MDKLVTIIDYGVGNIGSIANMLASLGISSKVASSPKDLLKARKIIFPGVGKFDYGLIQLRKSGLLPVLEQKVFEEKVPILGICVGMQLLFNKSEEGREKGLGWLDGEVLKFRVKKGEKMKVPHMGWNSVSIQNEGSPLVKYLLDNEENRFYFVHSYYVHCADDIQLMNTNYGGEFSSAVQKDNIYACQFHPEKSHRFGKSLLKGFGDLPC